jgi:beta-N-acetylhexosaminidase
MEVERISATVGTWLAAMGVDVNFAPVLDVDSEPVNPVIGPRSYGGDALRVAELGAAALRGFREGGILACAKHFPGHGATTVDSHLTLPTCDVPLSVLEERELVPFREALQLAPLVMTAHVLYPALDADWPATLSPAIVGGWLRGKLNTRGVVVTDAMEMAGVADSVAPGQAPLQALAARPRTRALGGTGKSGPSCDTKPPSSSTATRMRRGAASARSSWMSPGRAVTFRKWRRKSSTPA